MAIPRGIPPEKSEGESLNLELYTGVLPPPVVLGCPDKFSGWRPGQEAAIMTSIDSDKQYVIECLPTGAGKSLIYTAEAIINGGRCLILTSTKALQDQLNQDFKSLGIMDVRGQTNYECVAIMAGGAFEYMNPRNSWIPVADGPCMDGEACDLMNGGCHYYDAIRRAAQARIVVTNYAFWLTQARMPPELSIGTFDLLICDEAHNTVNELCDYLTVELDKKEAEWLYGAFSTRIPGNVENIALVRDWSVSVINQLDSLLEYTHDRQVRRKGRKIRPKLVRLAGMNQNNWVGETASLIGYDTSLVARWDPIWPLTWAGPTLFRSTPKVVLSSATVRLKTGELLGLNIDEQVLMFESPLSFPAKRRPVYHVDSTEVDYRMTEEEICDWIRTYIDPIIEGRLDRKGIVHCISYKRQEQIKKYSLVYEAAPEMFFTPNRLTTRTEIERFKAHKGGGVMISPAVTTGYDFKYDQCEYQIILKVPRPDTRSKVMQARMKMDKDYVPYIAMQELVQMAGRGMRAEDDRCETFVVDNNFKWFMKKYGKRFAPKWFRDAVWRDVWPIPDAAPKLQLTT